ncbi:hypothetical protein D9611_012557 [Ephemerocybe angulata]|uniref:C2H2-type domain-containing protein n=1 Tax=Ephemerocybe angulata TaxID=980116 RepID=A0A8H5ET09_9AGAR|nr:hypothetical protein D9611_012557 [Tulosesus angulatus]
MRVSILSIVSLTLVLANFVSGHSDDALCAREYVDNLSLRKTNTDVLADISTRYLISELSERLERLQANFNEHILEHSAHSKQPVGKAMQCPHCSSRFFALSNLNTHIANAHSNKFLHT